MQNRKIKSGRLLVVLAAVFMGVTFISVSCSVDRLCHLEVVMKNTLPMELTIMTRDCGLVTSQDSSYHHRRQLQFLPKERFRWFGIIVIRSIIRNTLMTTNVIRWGLFSTIRSKLCFQKKTGAGSIPSWWKTTKCLTPRTVGTAACDILLRKRTTRTRCSNENDALSLCVLTGYRDYDGSW